MGRDSETEMRKPWLTEEVDMLKALAAQKLSCAAIAKQLGDRTEAAVRRKLQNLKVSKSALWTEQEDKTLIDLYPTHGAKVLSGILKRSPAAINARASKVHNLKYESTNAWTEKNIAWLIENYQKLGALESAKYLGRSPTAIHAKAHKLGLEGKALGAGYSPISIQWLKSFNNSNILHAENGGEQKILKYRVDGFDPVENIIYEFHGDAFHGNLDIYSSTDRPHPFNKEITAEELWQKTFDRMKELSKIAPVIYIWENDYRNGRESERF